MNTGKPVLITGCSSGIGLCAARQLNQRGYAVIASARKQADVERLNQEGLQAVQLDLNDSTSIQQAVDAVLKKTKGRLYGLFNNGGYGQTGAVEDLSRAVLLEQLQTNLLGWHELTRRIIPVMRQQGEGRIIQNSSVLGFVAMPYRGAYNCSKFALEGLTDTLRLELRGSGIFISLIEPGPISSHFRQNALLKLRQNVDMENSVHRDQYRSAMARLEKPGPAAPFTLPPEAVVDKLIHALESRRPKARYRVTVPTHVFALIKRLLPDKSLDWLLGKASGDGAR